MPTLYIIDGYAQFFRAYHAIRTPMTSPVTKEPTNLTFGFVGMLLKLLRADSPHMLDAGGPPSYLAVALDVSGDRGTFRSQIDPEYKATRPPPPEDLPQQVERCLSLLKEINVPLVGAEAFEADDAIATIIQSLKDKHPDLRIRIVSKDKDLKQLLRPPTTDAAPVELYDVHTDEVIDAAALASDTGLSPNQVVDMLALMGDNVDNIKGVEGVGPKTAAQLIAEHGSLDNLINAIKHDTDAKIFKGKRGENLRAKLDQLPTNIDLVKLRTDAPIQFDLDASNTNNLRLEKLAPILKELGFNRYQDELRQILTSRGQTPTDTDQTNPAQTTKPKPTQHPTFSPFGPGLFDNIQNQSEPTTTNNITTTSTHDYRCVRTTEDLSKLITELKSAGAFAVDTETTSLSPMAAELCGLSFATTTTHAWYLPTKSPEQPQHLSEQQALAALKPILEDPTLRKLGHNLKYDMLVLRNAGVHLRGVNFDSMVASYIIDASRSSHSLDALALALLGRTNISIKELIGTGAQQRTFDKVPLDAATIYAAEDADVSLALAKHMAPQLAEMQLESLFADLEMPLVEVLAELEWNGIAVDPDELDRQRDRLSLRAAQLRAQIIEQAEDTLGRPFNPDSPKQLAAVLFNKPDDPAEPGLGIKPIKRTKTGYSTDVEVLEKLAQDPSIESTIPELIVEHRQLTKLVSTYLVALKQAINQRTGRIHASFNQTVAATGRLSSSDPNLQNIPIRTDIGRDIRKAFVAPPNRVLITADYSQIELRLLAHLSKDPALIEAFHRGDDIHAAVAAQIHNVPIEQVTREQRSGAKMVNFGIVYGITPFGLARRLNISNTQADEIITGYKKRFAGIATFLEECIAQARSLGYVETMLKRRRPITDIESTNPSRRALAERMAINSVVQGSAADLIKLAMIDLHRRLKQANNEPLATEPRTPPQPEPQPNPALTGVKMILQIHDELVFEAPTTTAEQARDIIVARMETAMNIDVPLRVDATIAANWFDGK